MDARNIITSIRLNDDRQPAQVVLRPIPLTKYFKSGKDLEHMVVYGEAVASTLCMPKIFETVRDAVNYKVANKLSGSWHPYTLTDSDINRPKRYIKVISTNAVTPRIVDVPKKKTSKMVNDMDLTDERSIEMNTIETPREITQLNSTIVVDTTSLENIEVQYAGDAAVSFVNAVDTKSHRCKVMVPGLGTESMTFSYDDRFSVKLVGPVQLHNCKCHEHSLRPVYNTTINIDNELGETVRFDLSRVTDIEIKAINVDQDTNMYDLLLVIIPKFNPLTLNAIENAEDFSKYIYSDNSEARLGFRANNTISTPYKIFGWHVNGSSIVLDAIDDKNTESGIINANCYSLTQLYYELTELDAHRADISYFRITASIHTIDGDIVVNPVNAPLRLCKYTDTNQVFFKIG